MPLSHTITLNVPRIIDKVISSDILVVDGLSWKLNVINHIVNGETLILVLVDAKLPDESKMFNCKVDVNIWTIVPNPLTEADRKPKPMGHISAMFTDVGHWSKSLANFERPLVIFQPNEKCQVGGTIRIEKVEILEKISFDLPDPNLSDILMIAGDKTFHVCRQILGQFSKYFYKMIYEGEEHYHTIKILDCQASDFQDFLEILYGYETRWVVKPETFAIMLVLGRNFNVPRCLAECQKFMKREGIEDKAGLFNYFQKHGFRLLQLEMIQSIKTIEEVHQFQATEEYINVNVKLKRALFVKMAEIHGDKKAKSQEDSSKSPMESIFTFRQEKINFEEPRDNLTDIVLSVGDKKFHVGKQILANSSKYFYNLFYSSFKEKNQTDIKLIGIDKDDFEEFLQHVYNPNRKVKKSTVDSLAMLSDMYDATKIWRKCEPLIWSHPILEFGAQNVVDAPFFAENLETFGAPIFVQDEDSSFEAPSSEHHHSIRKYHHRKSVPSTVDYFNKCYLSDSADSTTKFPIVFIDDVPEAMNSFPTALLVSFQPTNSPAFRSTVLLPKHLHKIEDGVHVVSQDIHIVLVKASSICTKTQLAQLLTAHKLMLKTCYSVREFVTIIKTVSCSMKLTSTDDLATFFMSSLES